MCAYGTVRATYKRTLVGMMFLLAVVLVACRNQAIPTDEAKGLDSSVSVIQGKGDGGNTALDRTQGIEGVSEVSFTVCAGSACAQSFMDEVMHAQQVECALYDLSDPAITGLLRSKNASLVLDHGARKRNTSWNAPVFGPAKHTMHNKMCVLDQERVITGSYNPTGGKKKDMVVRIKGAAAARAFREEWDELRQGTFGGGPPGDGVVVRTRNGTVQVLFCPEDPCGKSVQEAVHQAREWILVEAYALTSKEVIDALLEAKEQGVLVAVLLEPSQDRTGVGKKLHQGGVETVQYPGKELMHRKVIVIDGEVVIAGSANPTFSGYYANDENLVIVRDQALAQDLTEQLLRDDCFLFDDLMFSKQVFEAFKLRC